MAGGWERSPQVAVVFGGRSTEHEISCISAGAIAGALATAGCAVRLVGIDRNGGWRLLQDLPETAGGDLPRIDGHGTGLDPCAALRGADVAFPVLHGPWGEDGSVQGLFETVGVPYVGSGVAASAVGMDKGLMKAAFAAAGLPCGVHRVVSPRRWREDPAGVLADLRALGSPLFIKPARAGSSVGIVRLTDPDELPAALAEAMAHDPRLIVERAVTGREIECGVLERVDGRLQLSVPGEIVLRAGVDFYDYRAKYLTEGADLRVPMDDLPGAQANGTLGRIEALARGAFEALGCEGLARVDMFLTDEGTVLLNEANTMPGFTPISMYPRMFAATGIDYPALVGELVARALQRPTGLR